MERILHVTYVSSQSSPRQRLPWYDDRNIAEKLFFYFALGCFGFGIQMEAVKDLRRGILLGWPNQQWTSSSNDDDDEYFG